MANFRGVNLDAAADQLKPGEFSYCQNATMSISGQLSTRAGATRVGPATGIVGGVWGSGTAYTFGNEVLVGGVSYTCILAHTGHTPPNATYWIPGVYVHSVFYLSDPVSTYPTLQYLYVIGVGNAIYGWSGGASWTQLATGFSGNPLTAVVYRMSGTGQPWLIIGDSAKMVKVAYVNGTWTVYQLGITPPADVANVTVLANQLVKQIDLLVVGGSQYVVVNGAAGAPSANGSNPSTVVRASNVVTWTGTSIENFVQGLVGEVAGFVGAHASLNGTFEIAGITSNQIFTYNQTAADLSVVGAGEEFIAGLGTQVSSGATCTMSLPLSINLTEIEGNPSLTSDAIKSWVFIDNISNVTDFKIIFDIDPSSVSGGMLTATAFTKNYYEVSVFGALATGWTQVSVSKSSFTRVGQGVYDWSGVVAYRFVCVAASAATPTFYVNDMYLQGASYPNASVGVGYDYRYTDYNPVTQSESNPSPVMSVDAYPVNQPVELIPTDYSTDPQVTQIRWYRRGGTLASNWYLLGAQPNTGPLVVTAVSMNAVGDVATYTTASAHGLAAGDVILALNVTNAAFDGIYEVATIVSPTRFTVQNLTAGGSFSSSGGTIQAIFIDAQSDIEIAAAPVLNLGNDVPVTTIAQNGTILYGVPLPYLWGPLNGITIFGDGDPNQPGNLYWCNASNPDGWSSFNYVEVTQSSDPLTLGVYWQGNSWARSMEGVSQIGPGALSGSYTVSDVSAGESLAAPWAIIGGSNIPLMPWLGKSGIFTSTGGQGQSITDEKLWPLFNPKSTRTDAVDWTYPQFLRLAFYDHHLRFTYQGKDGVKRFYRYDFVRGNFDGPHVWAFGGCVEVVQPEVQENLLIGGADGNLYQESVAATTDNGVAINVLVQGPVHIPAGWENTEEWGVGSFDTQAPVGGIAVNASFNSTLTSFVNIGTCVNTTRATTSLSLEDNYSRGAAFQFVWSGAGAIFGYTILWRDDGVGVVHAETPQTSYGAAHWQHVYKASVTLRSTAVVNCTVTCDNNVQTVQAIPSTGGTRIRQDIFWPRNKFQLIQVSLDSTQPFRVYASDCSMELWAWDEINPREVQLPFAGSLSP